MTLPIRRWLALALLLAILLPVVVTATVAWHFLAIPAVQRFAAADDLRANVARWHDPAWREATRDRWAADGIDFVLYEGGAELYRTSPDPLVGESGAHPGRFVERYDITGDPGEPRRTAIVYALVNQTAFDQFWLLPLTALTTLALTLAGIAWFLGRTMLRPLAATGGAARRIAAGDLEIALPRSRVREVADVGAAFTAMSAALRESIGEQARLEQERRLFIGAVVHDLRTPLFALRGALDGLQRGITRTAEQRARYLDIAVDNASALEHRVSDLFDFSRLEYLDQTPERERLDLGALLERLIAGFEPQAEAKQLALVLERSDTACDVDGDARLLTRALENLLDNALRFTPTGGSVRVACAAADGWLRLTISDSGPGIPPEDLGRVFSPLFRSEGSRNRRTGGAGLGLSTARRIVEAHGGTLVAANGAGGGAVFTLTLPRGAFREP